MLVTIAIPLLQKLLLQTSTVWSNKVLNWINIVFKLCSPSRCSLLTGRLPIHVNDDNKINPTNYNPKDPVSGFQGIPRNMTVIAEKMKEAGYATHQVGKWDAGMATPSHIPIG